MLTHQKLDTTENQKPRMKLEFAAFAVALCGVVAAKEGAVRGRNLAPRACQDLCQDFVNSCAAGLEEVVKCSVGDCIQYKRCNDRASPDKKWCIGYCQQFNPAGGRCDPGAAAGTCPLGPQYSTGDCIKATCN
jgi:hypothetical protein